MTYNNALMDAITGEPPRTYGYGQVGESARARPPPPKKAPEVPLGGDSLNRAILGDRGVDVTRGEGLPQVSGPLNVSTSSSSAPPYSSFRPPISLSKDAAYIRKEFNKGGIHARNALLSSNQPRMRRLREESERQVDKNLVNDLVPPAFRLKDLTPIQSVPGSHFSTKSMLSHDDLVRRCAQGYRLPAGAPAHLKNMVDNAVTTAAKGLAKSSGSKYAKAWIKWEKWVSEHIPATNEGPVDPLVACGQHELVSAYITDMVSNTGSISSAQSAISAMQYYVGLSNLPFHKSSFMEAVIKGLKRSYGKSPEKRDGFTIGQVVDILNHIMTTEAA